MDNLCAFIGLGNPGASYASHRHNVGFMAVQAIVGARAMWRTKHQGLVTDMQHEKARVFVLKPQTYMNESGRAVVALSSFYKIPPQNIWVFHDDLDLAPGKVRIKIGGGLAGHNGLRSIAEHLGTPDFGRVRIGIGHPGDKTRVHGYVLSDFTKADAVWLDPLLEALALHAHFLITQQPELLMNRIAQSAPFGYERSNAKGG